MKLLTVLAVGLLLLATPTQAARFRVIDGTTIEGRLRAVDAEAVMTAEPTEGEATRLPADELKRIEFQEDREPQGPLDGVVLHLPGGGRICGALFEGSQTHIAVDSRSLGRIRLPLSELLAVEFRRPGDRPKEADKMLRAMLDNQTRDDISFSVNGDQMPGILIGFDGEKVVLRTDLGEMTLEHERLFGLSFAARERPPEPASLLAVARCDDGSVVTGHLRESADGRVRLALLAGPEVRLDAGELIDLAFKHGKLVYLSDLDPAEESRRPYFSGDHTWPYRRDESYDRQPLRVGGEAYRKGLGMFSGMTLRYDLGGGFKKFVARVGIDDADITHRGDVTVRVLADGREVFRKDGLTRRAGPAAVELSVEGVKSLELVVDFGENFHFGDFTDWADAHLIR